MEVEKQKMCVKDQWCDAEKRLSVGTCWLKDQWEGARELTPQSAAIVGDFTILWNYFESRFLALPENGRETKEGLKKLAEILTGVSQQEGWNFFRRRYIDYTTGCETEEFKGLFGKSDRQEDEEDECRNKLRNTNPDIYYLLLIVYRIRNNLFHGNKPTHTLNDQAETISHASKVLMSVMSSVPTSALVERSN